jgi:hypothetical protein
MDVATTGNSGTSPAANRKPRATSHRVSAANTKPNDARPGPKLRSGVTNVKPRAADSECIASDHAKVPRIPKPKPKPKPGPRADAPVQIGPAELGKGCHVLGLAQYRF